LKVRRGGGRKRAIGTSAPMTMPQGPNQRWTLDFVSDAFACPNPVAITSTISHQKK
jgi:putative transposase